MPTYNVFIIFFVGCKYSLKYLLPATLWLKFLLNRVYYLVSNRLLRRPFRPFLAERKREAFPAAEVFSRQIFRSRIKLNSKIPGNLSP